MEFCVALRIWGIFWRLKLDELKNKTEEKKLHTHLIMLCVITVGTLGIITACILEGWEVWAIPLFIFCTGVAWKLHIFNKDMVEAKERYYLAYISLCVFYYGIHPSNLFDVSIVSALNMAIVAQLERIKLVYYALLEYMLIYGVQVYYVINKGGHLLDAGTIASMIMHVLAVVSICWLCLNTVKNRIKTRESIEEFIQNSNDDLCSMEDFLTNVSHELRTPVNAVTGMASLLLKEKDDHKTRAISEAGERLAQQVGDILDYTELTRDEIIIKNEVFQVSALVNDLVMRFKKPMDSKRLDFVVNIDGDVPENLVGDVVRIRQIVSHALANAVQFTDVGGVYLHLEAVRRPYGINLNISVTDTGKGMSPEELEKASRGFYQADRRRVRSSGGIGLGLAIVFGFAEKMNGFVKLQSTEDEGTMVKICLPLQVMGDKCCLDAVIPEGLQILTYTRPTTFESPKLREFYINAATTTYNAINVTLKSVMNLKDFKKALEEMPFTHILAGIEEYEEDPEFFKEIAGRYVVGIASAEVESFRKLGNMVFMPKPIYSLSIIKLLNIESVEEESRINELGMGLDLSKTRALVVDDERMNLMVAKGLFSQYGMEVDTAGSGAEAIRMYENTDYDVIFMDHMMPEMDGITAMKAMKEMGFSKGRKTRVVALTANAVSGARELFMAEGFDGFLAKPIDLSEFERIMKSILPLG